MVDREKVIKGLECCYVQRNEVPPLCEDCPYMNPMEGTCDSLDELLGDALTLLKVQEPLTSECISSAIECLLHPQDADDSDMAKAIDTAVRAMRLLKAQEPRVMTLEELRQEMGHPVHWCETYEYEDYGQLYGTANGFIILRPGLDDDFFEEYDGYGKSWRVWTSRPDGQESATPWQ